MNGGLQRRASAVDRALVLGARALSEPTALDDVPGTAILPATQALTQNRLRVRLGVFSVENRGPEVIEIPLRRLEVILENHPGKETKIAGDGVDFLRHTTLNSRIQILNHAIKGIHGATALDWRQGHASTRQQPLERAEQLCRPGTIAAVITVLRCGHETDPLRGEREGVVQMAGQLVASPSVQRLLEGGEFGIVMKCPDDFTWVKELDEGACLVEAVDLVADDDGVESVPLRTGAIEVLDRKVGRCILESNVGDTLEELVGVASDLVQPRSPGDVGRFNAQVLRTDLCVLKYTELPYTLHEASDRGTVDRQLVGKLVDVLRKRVHEDARSKHRRA